MSSPVNTSRQIHFVPDSPVRGLAVAELRVASPEATLICVHGALDRAGSFTRLSRRINRFDVLAYDRRGYQGSRDLAPVDLAHHVADLLALVDREASRQPVILFGHSFGGVVTFKTAIEAPSQISLVVNYESPLPWVLRRGGVHPIASDDPASEAERFFRRVVSDRAWERLGEAQRESRRLDGATLLNDLRIVRDETPPFDLSTLRVAATYAHGDGNGAEYYRALSEALVELNSKIVTVELEHAGHDAHLRNTAQLAAVIEERWDATCA
ncbi:MAG TPA: alpha/beta hydrolase [Acidimicrobiales bacterium]|nr:alpha/beta hydrolase [Acidimicrobiales bacterium]